MKFSIIGLGYVGGAMAKVLERVHDIATYDIDPKKNPSVSSLEEAIDFADAFLLCLPTNFSDETQAFDTKALDETAETILKARPESTLIVKSTVPMGYCSTLQEKHPAAHVLFAPEFLRESKAEKDALHPSRIVIGSALKDEAFAQEIGDAFLKALEDPSPIRYMSLEEAEAVKLFSNAYLALRIGFFNELDTYAASKGLSSSKIIESVGLDPRIGGHYNNPSFGYGGYCLPKDTKQLEANYKDVPEALISAVIESNSKRKDWVVQTILDKIKDKKDSSVLIYRLRMENGSSSIRYTSMKDIACSLKGKISHLAIYEPLWEEDTYFGIPVIHELKDELSIADLIVANRYEETLKPYLSKVFSRDKNL